MIIKEVTIVPTDTFYNLGKDKQKKIFDAAVQEFAYKRFSEASINQIVKTAGIPRGSFYQYFNDKEDLYLYLLAEIGQEKLAVAQEVEQLKPEADFFAAMEHRFRAIMHWVKSKPLYHRIGMLMEEDESELVQKLQAQAPELVDHFIQLVERDKNRGLIRPEVDARAVINMLQVMNLHYVQDYYRTGDEEQLVQRFGELLEIIRGGIASV
jgi:AcrR family transcriptional regulator